MCTSNHELTVEAASSSRSLRRPTQSPLRPRLRHGALLGEAPGRKVRRDAAGDGAADAAALARSRGALPQPAQFAAVRLEGLSQRTQGPTGTNQPQTRRLWPGLRLVGAGGRVGSALSALCIPAIRGMKPGIAVRAAGVGRVWRSWRSRATGAPIGA